MTDKITRKDAEAAYTFIEQLAIARCNSRLDGQVNEHARNALAILRQCRIIEPGGLDAETVKQEREACCAEIQKVLTNYGHEGLANKLTFRIMRGMHTGEDHPIEKGE